MIEFIIKNAEWLFSGIGVYLIALVFGIILAGFSFLRSSRDKRDKRIEEFINEFRKLYNNDGVKLEILIPAGINSLKNDREIKLAFKDLMNIVPNHPLRNWRDDVEKIGYKKFFSHVVNSGRILDKKSIEIFLSELQIETENGIGEQGEKPNNAVEAEPPQIMKNLMWFYLHGKNHKVLIVVALIVVVGIYLVNISNNANDLPSPPQEDTKEEVKGSSNVVSEGQKGGITDKDVTIIQNLPPPVPYFKIVTLPSNYSSGLKVHNVVWSDDYRLYRFEISNKSDTTNMQDVRIEFEIPGGFVSKKIVNQRGIEGLTFSEDKLPLGITAGDSGKRKIVKTIPYFSNRLGIGASSINKQSSLEIDFVVKIVEGSSDGLFSFRYSYIGSGGEEKTEQHLYPLIKLKQGDRLIIDTQKEITGNHKRTISIVPDKRVILYPDGSVEIKDK